MEDAKISTIRKQIDKYLFPLEQAGREKFGFLEARTARACRNAGTEKFLVDPAPRCVEDICFDLKIKSGWALSGGEAPQIFIAHPTSSSSFGPSVAINAAEREARKQDNKEKLGKATPQERHLVVYVDKTRGLPWFALIDFEPPSKLPKLPREITDIWLIGPSGGTGKDEFVVWRASTREPWYSQRLVIPHNECKAS